MCAMQGQCNKGSACSYLHADIDPDAPYCEEFRAGFCGRGRECSRKHFTEDTIRHYASHPKLRKQIQKRAHARLARQQQLRQPAAMSRSADVKLSGASAGRAGVTPAPVTVATPGGAGFVRDLSGEMRTADLSAAAKQPEALAPLQPQPVPELLRNLPDAEYPGSNGTLYHIGGVLVFDEVQI